MFLSLALLADYRIRLQKGQPMVAFLIRRLLWLPVLLFFISLITFALGLYGPGDPVQVLVGIHANPDTIARLKHEYGFDQPFYVQYLNYVLNALQGNFGYSLVKYRDQAVGRLIADALPVTIQLNLLAIILGVLIGVPLGLVAGLKRDSWIDLIIRGVVIAGISFPIILLNPVLTFLFSRAHPVDLPGLNFHLSLGPFLPMVGGHWDGIFSTKVILPAFIEASGVIAVMTRQMRAGMIEVLSEDYIRTARAKGLREYTVIVRHAMRNALIPIATIMGLMLGGLVAGSFLVENWFGIPGVGSLGFDALFSRDYYITMALTLLIATAYVFANVLVDLTYGFLDPRIRKS
ncbi:MAG TPA: ABC transporter permease [Anaerolineae bacterium]